LASSAGGERMTSRFGQGQEFDRNRPHIFHRDYWALRVIREGVTNFVHHYGKEMRGGRALDFGAGDSPYGPVFAEAGVELLRADIEPGDASVLAIEAGRVPLPDGGVHAVISTQVLEHVPDVAGYLREAWRLLRPGGLLYLSTHGAFILHRHPTDLRRWTTDGLCYELQQAGFAVERVEPKIGVLAMSTHMRAITFGGLTRRVPLMGWLRPIIYLLFNLRMGVEDWLTPRSVMEAHPELLLAVGRKPSFELKIGQVALSPAPL
jgi:SAM-dependent methyltransferase